MWEGGGVGAGAERMAAMMARPAATRLTVLYFNPGDSTVDMIVTTSTSGMRSHFGKRFTAPSPSNTVTQFWGQVGTSKAPPPKKKLHLFLLQIKER